MQAWRDNGYVVVEDYLDRGTVDRALTELHEVLPTWEQVRDGEKRSPRFFISLTFPYATAAQNDLTVHPDLIDFAERALGGDVLLTHSEILSKYAGEQDYEQSLHLDYGNNTLVVPAAEGADQVASITYYTDVTLDLGPTYVAPFPASEAWRSAREWSREDAPELYAAEEPVTVPAGSILIYTMKTFHRGSAFRATEGSRFTHHTAFCPRGMTWGGAWFTPFHGKQEQLDALLSRCTPAQRAVLGFPPIGHPYWTAANIDAVAARYPDMDLDPYR